eukprot:1156870-Pelagomonas_calceolata.AAC.6
MMCAYISQPAASGMWGESAATSTSQDSREAGAFKSTLAHCHLPGLCTCSKPQASNASAEETAVGLAVPQFSEHSHCRCRLQILDCGLQEQKALSWRLLPSPCFLTLAAFAFPPCNHCF